MVYQIFNDGIDRRSSLAAPSDPSQYSPVGSGFGANNKRGITTKKTRTKSSLVSSLLPNYLSVKTESRLAFLLILIIKTLLFLYDIISLPVYFIIQRPDKQANNFRRIASRQVDANTWVRLHPQIHPILQACTRRHKVKLNDANHQGSTDDLVQPVKAIFMGATMSEIFANSVMKNESKSCLGYRAVVTCPVLTMNEEGQHVMQDKSFRSDYTWYTYSQVGQRVQDIASGLYQYGLYPQSKVLFMASTSLEWFCTAQACFQLSIQLVLASEITDCLILKKILDDTKLECIMISCDKIRSLCQLIDSFEHKQGCMKSSKHCQCFALKQIIIIDWPFAIDFEEKVFNKLGESLHDWQRARANDVCIQVLSMGQVEESGIESPIELRCSSSLSRENLSSKNLIDSRHCSPILASSSRLTRKFPPSPPTRKVSDNNPPQSLEVSHGLGSGKLSYSSPALHRKRTTSVTGDSFLRPKLEGKLSTKQKQDLSLLIGSPKPTDLAIISYTFGTLGQLKAIMITHNQLARSSTSLYVDGLVDLNDIHCTILPLDNMVELMIEMSVFAHGGAIGYSCNLNTMFYDGKELFARDKSDLVALNPTFLMVRPYILERLRTSSQNYLQSRLNPLVGFVMRNALYDYKKYWAQKHYGTPLVDRFFCIQLRSLFGSNVNYILCNGTTDCSETKDFFAFMLDLPVIELYGPEEAVVSLVSVNDIWDYKRDNSLNSKGQSNQRRAVSGYGWRLFQFDQYRAESDDDNDDEDDNDNDNTLQLTTDCSEAGALERKKQVNDDIEKLLPPRVNKNIYRQDFSKNILITSSVLCSTFGTRIRLEDWEDFRISDKPYPRGRLVIGGDVVCSGYLLRSHLSGEHFYRDSNSVNWFRTNDIARVFPNGSFEIISAISDLIKMVDGQFVSLSQIEHILRNSRFVDNVCSVCGDDRMSVINLVVPNLRRLALKSPNEANLKMAIGPDPEPEELSDVEFRREVCNDRLLTEFVGNHLRELLNISGFSSIENKILLVPEIWTPQSELVTPAFEPKRIAIRKFYANDIQSIVQSMGLKRTSKRLSARLRGNRLFRKSSSPQF